MLILSNCTKNNNRVVRQLTELPNKSNVELKDKIHEQNISESKITENYSASETAAQKFDSINSAMDYIFGENFKLKEEKYYNLQDVLASFPNYRLIRENTYESIHGGFYTIYIIEGDHYTVEVWDIHSSNDGYKIYPLEFAINETNYLHLFPYQTMNEYLTMDNFGEIYEIKEETITYTRYNDRCTLRFSNGLLKSIEYKYFMP